RDPRPPLSPYTTLFRSDRPRAPGLGPARAQGSRGRGRRCGRRPDRRRAREARGAAARGCRGAARRARTGSLERERARKAGPLWSPASGSSRRDTGLRAVAAERVPLCAVATKGVAVGAVAAQGTEVAAQCVRLDVLVLQLVVQTQLLALVRHLKPP